MQLGVWLAKQCRYGGRYDAYGIMRPACNRCVNEGIFDISACAKRYWDGKHAGDIVFDGRSVFWLAGWEMEKLGLRVIVLVTLMLAIGAMMIAFGDVTWIAVGCLISGTSISSAMSACSSTASRYHVKNRVCLYRRLWLPIWVRFLQPLLRRFPAKMLRNALALLNLRKQHG